MKHLSLEKSFHSSLRKQLVKFWKRLDLLFLLIFVLAFAVRFHYAIDFVMNDEVGGGYLGYGYPAWGYFDTATAFHGYMLRADFTGLYNWGLKSGANYPVLPFLMSASMLLLNSPTLVAARFPVEVCGALLAAIIYLLGRDLFSRFAGLVSGLFVALDPLLIAYSRVAYLDVPMELFFVISVFTLYRGLTRHNKLFTVFSGVACGLAVLSKVTAWVLLPLALLLLFLWKFQSRERLTLIAKNFTIFMSSFVLVLLAAFPWVGYEILTGRYFSWYISASSSTFSGATHFAHTSIIVFMVGKLTIVELLAFGLGITAAVWQLIRAEYRFSRIVVLLWFLVAFFSLELVPVILNHYLVFLIPPVLLLAGHGVLSCAKIIGKSFLVSKKLAFLSKPELGTRILSVILLLLVVGSQLITVLQYYPYFSLYSSPLVNDPFHVFEFNGEEAIQTTADFLKNHVAIGSVIAVAGQVHLFAYCLPEYKIVGLGEFYPYSDEPIAFLYLSGIRYLVVQVGFEQLFGETDAVLLKLSKLEARYVSNIHNNDLIWVYDFNGRYQTLFSHILEGGWKNYQGNFSEGSTSGARTLVVGEGFTYAFAIKEIGNVTSRSSITFAWEVSDYTVSSFRVEVYFNGKQTGNIYPPKKVGLWTSVPAVLQEQGELSFAIVAVGYPGQFLEINSIALVHSG